MAISSATGFSATVSGTDVNLEWTRPSDVPAGANTIIKQAGSVIQTITDASTTTHTVEDLTPGTNPSFTVHFELDDSEPVSATASVPLPSVLAPHAAVSEGAISLTWQRPSNLPSDTTVVIKRGDVIAKAVSIHRSSTATNYIDRDNITAGQMYTYHFRFELGDIDGPNSSPVTVMIPSS